MRRPTSSHQQVVAAGAVAAQQAAAQQVAAAQQAAQQAAADVEQWAKVAELDANKRLLEVDQARHDETQAKRQRLIAEDRLRAEQKGHTEERQRRRRAEAAHLELEKQIAQREEHKVPKEQLVEEFTQLSVSFDRQMLQREQKRKKKAAESQLNQ
jgi:hypothetical protein